MVSTAGGIRRVHNACGSMGPFGPSADPLAQRHHDVKYHLRNYINVAADSSYNNVSPADSIYRTVVNQNVEGWMIALTRMHVGDSCTVIVPYQQGYGSVSRSDAILPFSNLIFDMKLVNIYKYKAN